MRRITVELSDEIADALERIAAADHRSVDNWLDTRLRREFYGAVAMMPEGFRNMPFELNSRPRITSRIRARVWRDSGSKCAYCERPLDPFIGWEVDHIVPLKKGGANAPENLCAACDICNAAKGTRDADEYRASLRRVAS